MEHKLKSRKQPLACIECIHHHVDVRTLVPTHNCAHLDAACLVTGAGASCISERSVHGKCGPEGRNFSGVADIESLIASAFINRTFTASGVRK